MRLVTERSSMRRVDLTRTAARFDRLHVRRDVAETSALIGVSRVGVSGESGPLAIGLWTRFVDPRLAFPLLRSRRRHPDMADIALAFSPSVMILSAIVEGYVVSVVGSDLVAVELVGLAIQAASDANPESRSRPWEDPIVQRATEIDLGVQRPDQIDLRTQWAGPPDPAGVEMLTSLSAMVRELLNLRDP